MKHNLRIFYYFDDEKDMEARQHALETILVQFPDHKSSDQGELLAFLINQATDPQVKELILKLVKDKHILGNQIVPELYNSTDLQYLHLVLDYVIKEQHHQLLDLLLGNEHSMPVIQERVTELFKNVNYDFMLELSFILEFKEEYHEMIAPCLPPLLEHGDLQVREMALRGMRH